MIASHLTDTTNRHEKVLGDVWTALLLVAAGVASAFWATRSGFVTEEILAVLKSEETLVHDEDPEALHQQTV
jgi:hypothetical protein